VLGEFESGYEFSNPPEKSVQVTFGKRSLPQVQPRASRMNSVGCPNLFATDEVFRYDQTSYGTCDASLTVWIVMGVIAVLLRAISLVMILRLWCRRETIAKKSDKYKNRLPIVPAVFVIALLAHILFWVLGGLNIISKGYAAILFNITWLCFAIPYLIYCLKFVRLGLRDAKSLRKWKAIRGDESRLAKMDPVGRVVFMLAISSLVGVVISQGILSPILVDNPVPFFSGFALVSLFSAFSTAFLVSHIRRLLQS
jgi:hypothetical protein